MWPFFCFWLCYLENYNWSLVSFCRFKVLSRIIVTSKRIKISISNKESNSVVKFIDSMAKAGVTSVGKYSAMIKFLVRHPIQQHCNPGPHACAIDGIMPGSKDCVSVKDFLSKISHFRIIPYRRSVSSDIEGCEYGFSNRNLEENEVSSISELPKKFQMRPMEEYEMEYINNGGVY